MGERIVAMRIPDVEKIATAGRQDTMDLAVGFVLVGIKHHAELTDDGIEAGVRERQLRGIGGLEFDLLARLEFLPRKLEHRRVEVGRSQARAGRQGIAQPAGDDAGSRRRLQHPRRHENAARRAMSAA
ncbi:hypothetical protein AJ88_00985 [Mesorhizobium amorphae CCBAU 01583]|nr:hypothetical protein AJ88_00985 [Mesorhizobium amorphae CCBAU 01583]